jgi:hypothetical protein
LRIGRILIARVEVEIALRGGAGLFVFLGLVQHEGLHDQRALGVFGIGIKPLDFLEIDQRIGRPLAGFQLDLALAVDLLGRQVFEFGSRG